MTHILSFMFGALLIFCFIEINTKQLKDHFQYAYQVGRDDGYTLGKAEHECERLHWETLDGKPR